MQTLYRHSSTTSHPSQRHPMAAGLDRPEPADSCTERAAPCKATWHFVFSEPPEETGRAEVNFPLPLAAPIQGKRGQQPMSRLGEL